MIINHQKHYNKLKEEYQKIFYKKSAQSKFKDDIKYFY